jgi:lysyl oxidase
MRRRRTALLAALAVTTVAAAVVPATLSSANTPKPSLKLFSVQHDAQITRFGKEHLLFANLGVYLGSVHGAFEIDVHKHHGELLLTQVVRKHGVPHVIRKLPTDPGTTLRNGIGHFLDVTWLDKHGTVVSESQLPFCPAGYSVSRVDDSGPIVPTYPQSCWGSRFTHATVWGLNRGWAVQALGYNFPAPNVPDGSYTLQIAVRNEWVKALHIQGNTMASIKVDLLTDSSGGCTDICPHSQFLRADSTSTDRSANKAPVTTPPGPAPDLRPLPAWNPTTSYHHHSGKDFLNFAATVWNAGPGPLLVEGFRNGATRYMKAKQYYMRGDKVVAKTWVGRLHYDTRHGHHHWHFQDFARYELIVPKTGQVIRSTKQSFCIAPTDAINLTLPHAEWNPGSTGLYSACGDETSIWIREAMPSGWGDTYYQSVAGQAFNITDLPNGVYRIRVTTNPLHRLVETNYKNNVSIRKVRLGGTPGARTVEVLPIRS